MIVSNTPGALTLDGSASTGDCCHGLLKSYYWDCPTCPHIIQDYLQSISGTTIDGIQFSSFTLPMALPVGQYVFSLTYDEASNSDTTYITVTVVDHIVLSVWYSGIDSYIAANTILSFSSGVSLGDTNTIEQSVIYSYNCTISGPSGNKTFTEEPKQKLKRFRYHTKSIGAADAIANCCLVENEFP